MKKEETMGYFKNIKKTTLIIVILSVFLMVTACGSNSIQTSGDPEYESQVITIEGLKTEEDVDTTLTEITIGELRKLPQYTLDASYKRTTGLTEEFEMSGPYLREVIEYLGGNLDDYAGIGVMGKDGYYCLISKEVIDATPDLMLALVIDGNAKLDKDNAPARLAVQGQFGPYWVKMVEKIVLFNEIPEKEITSVWVFKNLAEGIEPYEYEYYGSKDDAIDLEQIFSRLDYVDSKAFFTMKSSDGFKKNEAINMVKSRYYIKVEGEDAPTNVSPYIKLGMNVHNIAWVSTNQDAAIFPNKMMEYMDTVIINGHEGITLQEVLYETEIESVKTETFDILGTEGEKITVSGEDMGKGILVPREDGGASVIWDESIEHKNIDNLLRIRLVQDLAVEGENEQEDKDDSKAAEPESISTESSSLQDTTPPLGPKAPNDDTVLTITGDGIEKELFLSMEDLKGLDKGYIEQCYSIVNNYPTRKFAVAKGISISYLLGQAGIKDQANCILVEASDGYKAELTKEQLLGKRYRYPQLISDSTANAVQVQPLLAWAFGEGQDFSKAGECDLRLVIGQQGIHDVNTAPGVQMVSKITISTKDAGSWERPTANMADGEIVLNHDYLDKVKIYYTLDGSEPTENSQVYNPSTTYFQPDLIKPIPVSGSGILKAKVIGYGKRDSEVLTYEY
ncbi:MAG: chitobiase/beta-hexosaminidase C-terminal domain-containing protein [Tepidanaerobacteraceae bacterium]